MLRSRTHLLRAALLALAVAAPTQQAPAQDPKPQSTTRAKALNGDDVMALEIYGFGMADAIYEFGQSNPDWFDVNRPSRLPAFEDEFGRDGRFWLSARQSRFGAKATHPSWHGKPFTAVFEFDLFGVGTDAGQTTIRPRHMYGQWGQFGAGQTNSVFMDVDVFPNTIEYWGPNGMLFFRNVMVWWQPINEKDGTRATIAIERPGASGDGGRFADRIELDNITARFPAPDISAEYRYGTGWG
ncbi:MAG: DcaP family trimeric outer membrane transporter, partial [Gemmatimonadaceae bacterium]